MKLLKKSYNIALLLLLFTSYISAQTLSTSSKKATAYYASARNSLSANEAIGFAKKAIEEDKTFTEAYWFLATQYFEQKKQLEQIATLKDAVQNTSYKINETRYRLAKAYYETGEYENAINTLNKISAEYSQQKISSLLRKNEVALKLKNNPVPFDPQNLEAINTPYDDYWPNISLNGKVFSTTVLIADKNKSNLEWNEDIYWSFRDETGEWKKSKSIGQPTNTEENEGSQNFSVDGKYMFFVACDKPDTRGGCDIYYCVHDGNNWSLPINPGEPLNSRHWETNPCLSADGKELFFSSNRPGGKGKKDIWECVVTKMPDGTLRFSNPINLSDSINTPDDEFSPFFHQDGSTLYFASNGHEGLGGFDIFYSKRNKDYVWSKPKNIGYPINTHKDEYGFIVSQNGENAYFSSDILAENEKDIYEINLYQAARPTAMSYFAGIVYERTEKTPIETEIEISNLSTNSTLIYNSDWNGTFATYLPANQEYAINVHKKGFLFYSNNITPSALLDNKVIIELDRIQVGQSLILNNISFETDSYKLLSKSTPELDYIYRFLTHQPEVNIEIIGHTDNVGTHEHNITLSQNRANEVAKYLINKGINKNRITCIGLGETLPIASNDTEEGRAKNRRTELKIKSLE